MIKFKGHKKKFKLLIGNLCDSLTDKEREELEKPNGRLKFVYVTENGIYVQWNYKKRGCYAYKHKDINVNSYKEFIDEIDSSICKCPFDGDDNAELSVGLLIESHCTFKEWWHNNVIKIPEDNSLI